MTPATSWCSSAAVVPHAFEVLGAAITQPALQRGKKRWDNCCAVYGFTELMVSNEDIFIRLNAQLRKFSQSG